ncbi:MAG: AMP-binding protein [Herpetosiphonaceae bacterium]|nr:AMP-binding protein [Herpetosiphonaceae bacterium]
MEYSAPGEREEQLRSRLQAILAESQSSHLQHRLAAAEITPATLQHTTDLTSVAILRKDELREIQAAAPPFGGLLGVPMSEIKRMFQSPGPIYDPQGPGADYWAWEAAFVAAGLNAGDRAIICFSFHLTPAGHMFDEGARALGCMTIPAGIGNQEQQIQTLAHSGATAYIGLPSYLNALLDKAAAQGVALALKNAFVSAEPLPQSLRVAIEARGINVQQGYGTADVGCIAYECAAKNGMHVRADMLVDICDTVTGLPLPAGEIGEVVVTPLNPVYPLVRFGTGDMSILSDAPCPCGRTTPRLLGIQGRLGQGMKVRGLFIYPHQLQVVFAGLPTVRTWSAVVTRVKHRDELKVLIAANKGDAELVRQVTDRLHTVLKLKCSVELVPSRNLLNPGQLRDERVWE